MKILVATDAWSPQVNGVVATLQRLAENLPHFGAELSFLTPTHFETVAMPRYREIRLAIPDTARARRLIEAFGADHIHVATEGPVGWMARRYCLSQRLPFTTSFHTRFPEYAAHHFAVPKALTYAALRRFHAPSAGIMVATPSLQRELAGRGFEKIMPWTRGVDTDRFKPHPGRTFGADGPVYLYVGRVSREKNIEAFLTAALPGTKVVVGDGPHLHALAVRFPHVRFAGRQTGDSLARYYATADVFVFPSRTDTFGLVMLEAMASGLPVAAYPVTGPIDIVEDGVSGALDEDLAAAARRALTLDRSAARRRALQFTWRATAEQFLKNVRHARASVAAKGAPARLLPERGTAPAALRK